MFTAAFIAGLELLVFGSESCLPCKAMMPVIARLESEGMKVYRIDCDKQSNIADAWKVTAVPTILVLQNRREVKRFVGLTSYDDIRNAVPTVQQQTPPAPVQQQRLTDNQIIERALACHVRVRVENPGEVAWGSGSVIHYGTGTGIGRSDVITARHVIAGNGQGRITLDDGTAYYSRAACIEVWPNVEVAIGDDVAVLVVDELPPASLPIASYGYQPLNPIHFVGSSGGGPPRVRKANITKQWTDPRTGQHLLYLDQPCAQGDSGGSVIDANGYLVGILNYTSDDGAIGVDLTRSKTIGDRTRQKSQQKAGINLR